MWWAQRRTRRITQKGKLPLYFRGAATPNWQRITNGKSTKRKRILKEFNNETTRKSNKSRGTR